MKKLLAFVMAAAMTLSLAACGGGSSSSAGTSTPAGTSSAPAASSTPADTADFKVGAIYINGQNDTAGYTFQHHSGITKAMENLGLDPASQLLIVDNVAEDYTAVSNAIDTLAGQGANIIFGISFGYIDAMNDKAEEYPEIIFSHATGYMGNDTNFNNYFGRIYQARYLTGVAAGLKSLEMGNNSIGYVAAYNREYAETCSGINAFALGVQAVNPDAVVHVNKTSTWGDENLERQAAQALIDTYDCCVIGQHCDSAQPQLVAAENNVFGCGYNSDMTEQAPNAHLTAAIWHWDVYYQAAIETAMTCGGAENFVTEMGGNAYYAGLSEGFVDASTLNELVAAPGTAAAMEAVRELIDSGEWDVFSGVKLNITVDAEAGTAAVEQVDAPLMSDGYELKDGEVVMATRDGAAEIYGNLFLIYFFPNSGSVDITLYGPGLTPLCDKPVYSLTKTPDGVSGITDDHHFTVWDTDGNVLRVSREYDKIYAASQGYILVRNGDVKLIDSYENEVAVYEGIPEETEIMAYSFKIWGEQYSERIYFSLMDDENNLVYSVAFNSSTGETSLTTESADNVTIG